MTKVKKTRSDKGAKPPVKKAAKAKVKVKVGTVEKATSGKAPTVVSWAKAKTFVGLKEIQGMPMTRGRYNKVQGWTIPVDENPKDKGFIVKYPDGYVSWSPFQQFVDAYQPTYNLSFSAALYLMKKGHKLARSGWNGKGMWVIYVPGTNRCVLKPDSVYAQHLGKRKVVQILPHFDMWTISANGRRAMLPGWLASQSDMDANDWEVVK